MTNPSPNEWAVEVGEILSNLDTFFPYYASYDMNILPEDGGYDQDMKIGALKLAQFKKEATQSILKVLDRAMVGAAGMGGDTPPNPLKTGSPNE